MSQLGLEIWFSDSWWRWWLLHLILKVNSLILLYETSPASHGPVSHQQIKKCVVFFSTKVVKKKRNYKRNIKKKKRKLPKVMHFLVVNAVNKSLRCLLSHRVRLNSGSTQSSVLWDINAQRLKTWSVLVCFLQSPVDSDQPSRDLCGRQAKRG